MKSRLLLLCGLAAAVIGLSAPAPVAGAEGPSLDDARAAIAEGRLDEAAQILAAVDPAEADVNDLDFLSGMLAVARGDYDAAQASFRAILRRDPHLTRVRLELARAYFLAHDDGAAAHQFERAAAEADLPPAVRRKIDAYLREIRDRRRWSLSLSVGFMPDSNVNAATASKTVEIYGIPFHLDPTARKKSGIGLTARIGAGYDLPVAPRHRLSAAMVLDELNYDGGDHDLRTISGSLGPRFRIGMWTELGLAAVANRRWYGGEGYSHALGGRVRIAARATPRLHVGGAFEATRMRYDRSTFLDGAQIRLDASVTYALDPTSAVGADFIHMKENTRLDAFDNARSILVLRYGRDFRGGWRLDLTGHGGLADYEAVFPAFGKERKDRSLGVELAVANRNIDVFGFMPVVAVGHERRDSNIPLYDYRRERLSFWLTRNF